MKAEECRRMSQLEDELSELEDMLCMIEMGEIPFVEADEWEELEKEIDQKKAELGDLQRKADEELAEQSKYW